jgi:hypothetical protein
MQLGGFGPSDWAVIMFLSEYNDHDLVILLLDACCIRLAPVSSGLAKYFSNNIAQWIMIY